MQPSYSAASKLSVVAVAPNPQVRDVQEADAKTRFDERAVPQTPKQLPQPIPPSEAQTRVDRRPVGGRDALNGAAFPPNFRPEAAPDASGGEEGKGGAEKAKLPQFGYFETVRRLGKGGMGEVYLVEDTRDFGCPTRSSHYFSAVKVMTAEVARDEHQKKRFLREGEIIAKLNHPNIITAHVLEVLPTGEMYLVLPYIEGNDLSKHCSRYTYGGGAPFLSPKLREEFMSGFTQVLQAMSHVHANGIAHRDLKPENVMLEERTGRTYVIDFGVAASFGAESIELSGGTYEPVCDRIHVQLQTLPGSVIGTPAYMSPQQSSENRPDPRNDIFALGVMLYEHLCGAHPFTGISQAGARETILAITEGEATPVRAMNASVCEELEAVCMNALKKDPAERIATCRDFLSELKAALLAQERLENPEPVAPLKLSLWRYAIGFLRKG